MQSKRCLDYELASYVVRAVWDEISEDGIEDFVPDLLNEYWVSLYLDELVGMYRLHQVNGITYQIHALILPGQREHAKESGKAILQWCLDNLEFHKLIAEIPAKYQNVYHFTKSMGFKDEGVNRESFKKDGKIWDAYRLGQTREEIWYQQ